MEISYISLYLPNHYLSCSFSHSIPNKQHSHNHNIYDYKTFSAHSLLFCHHHLYKYQANSHNYQRACSKIVLNPLWHALAMEIPVKSCLQFTLKLVNISIGFLGILAILYGVWMVRVWQEEMGTHKLFVPWFVHAFLGVGILMCAATFIGHVAADTANAQCLSFQKYVVTMFLLLVLETAFMAHIVLKSEWKKELPEDPTGGLDDFKDILNSNFKNGKWITPLVFLAQGCSILLATVLRTLKTDMSYDGDGDDAAPTLPFLNHPAPVIPYAVGDFPIASKNDAWKYRVDIV